MIRQLEQASSVRTTPVERVFIPFVKMGAVLALLLALGSFAQAQEAEKTGEAAADDQSDAMIALLLRSMQQSASSKE